jgi:cyclopropane fatty-acyl-phospholipid synthase-like methyltransferase
MARADIKDMKLYFRVERIYNELAELGYEEGAALRVADLFPYDQYHYHGTDAVDEALERLAVGPSSRVLDVGSGLGGPARYLAQAVGCEVTAIELQEDVHRVALDLTRRCGLAEHVHHVRGDILESPAVGEHDFVMSWLAFLHIPDRARLLERCRAALRPGGRLYVEDFHEIGRFSDAERAALAADVYCEYLPSLREFAAQCEEAGFEAVETIDVTPQARAFARDRAQAWRASRERHVRVHGEEVYAGLAHFFDVVGALFEGGHFGLGRVLATKPGE